MYSPKKKGHIFAVLDWLDCTYTANGNVDKTQINQ